MNFFPSNLQVTNLFSSILMYVLHFILTVRQHPKQLSRDHALRLKEKYHSKIPIAENFQKEFTKHEKSIKEFRFNQEPLNKILECIETYYRLLNHQTLPKDKCLYALSILSENCKIALGYYKNIRDLSILLEELDINITNEYKHHDGSSRSRNTPSTTAQLIENIRHETVGQPLFMFGTANHEDRFKYSEREC